MTCQGPTDSDMETVKKWIWKLNPNALILPISARTVEGFGVWADCLRLQVEDWNR